MLVAEEGAAATKELSATNRTEKYLNFDVKYFLRYFSSENDILLFSSKMGYLLAEAGMRARAIQCFMNSQSTKQDKDNPFLRPGSLGF